MDTALEKPRFDTAVVSEAIENTQKDQSTLRGSWPFGLDTLQQTTAQYSERTRMALISAFRWCVDPDHPLHLKDFAGRVQANDSSLYKFFTARMRYPNDHAKAGQLIHPKDDLIDRIEKWLALEKKRFAMGDTELVRTPTVKSIAMLCDLVRESQTIGFVVGPSHVGKTWGLELDYTVNNNHGRTIYVRLPAAAGLREVLQAICEAMNVSPVGNVELLKRRIRNALTKDMLLILDEVHLLAHTYKPKQFHKVMEVIREIHDTKKVGIVLCFTILDDVTAAKSRELQQLWRRAIHKLVLPPMPSVADMTAILEHNGLEFPARDLSVTVQKITEKPRELLRQIAKDDGLKAITERLRYSRNLAKKAGKNKNSWEFFIEAHFRIAKQAQYFDPKNVARFMEEWN